MSDMPQGWEAVGLGDLATPVRLGVDPASVPDLRYLGLEHIEAQTTKIQGSLPSSDVRSTSYRFVPGSTLYARLRPYLNKVCTVDFEGIGSGEFMIFPPSPHLAPGFLKFLLNQPAFVHFTSLLDTGDRPRVNWDGIKNFACGLPPLAEQRRIVAAIEEQLSRLDAAVAALQRVEQNSKRMRVSLIHRLITHNLPAECALSQLPDGWALTDLGSLIAEGPQNGLYLPAHRYGNGVSILRINDFQSDWVRPREHLKLVNADPEQAKMFAVVPGDLIVNRVNSMSHLGKCIIVGEALAGALFESNMMRIRLTDEIDGSYVALYLRSPLGRSLLLKNAKQAVNQASINQSDVRKTPIAIPPREEQTRIVSVYESASGRLTRIVEDVHVNLRRSASLRSSVLAAAFSGKLVDQDPTDEPASFLLEQIVAERASSTSHRPPRFRQPRASREQITA